MAIVLESEKPPLREEPEGALRVGNSRVLLELVLHAFDRGETPEAIVESYPTLALADVYSVIAYHLRHPGAFAPYLERREREGEEMQRIIEANQPKMDALRARIRARREAE